MCVWFSGLVSGMTGVYVVMKYEPKVCGTGKYSDLVSDRKDCRKQDCVCVFMWGFVEDDFYCSR